MSNSSPSLSEQLCDLQSQVAFQEDTLQTLDRVVTAQQSRIDRLEALVEALQARLGDLGAWVEEQRDEPPPPHY